MQLGGVFEACLKDLKGGLAATRKEILRPILILIISPLKLKFFFSVLLWHGKTFWIGAQFCFFFL